jgi:hypothetical protein
MYYFLIIQIRVCHSYKKLLKTESLYYKTSSSCPAVSHKIINSELEIVDSIEDEMHESVPHVGCILPPQD